MACQEAKTFFEKLLRELVDDCWQGCKTFIIFKCDGRVSNFANLPINPRMSRGGATVVGGFFHSGGKKESRQWNNCKFYISRAGHSLISKNHQSNAWKQIEGWELPETRLAQQKNPISFEWVSHLRCWKLLNCCLWATTQTWWKGFYFYFVNGLLIAVYSPPSILYAPFFSRHIFITINILRQADKR